MTIPEILMDAAEPFSMIDRIVSLAGTGLLGFWLVRNSFGTTALINSPERANRMHVFTPFIAFLLYWMICGIGQGLSDWLLTETAEWEKMLIYNGILCLAAVIAGAVIIYLAKANFTAGLKGFGLGARNIFKDLGASFVNLLSAWPIMLIALILTIIIGKLFDPDFQIAQHEELQSLLAYPQTSLKILIIITACLVTPIIEELLFRGLFQTMFRKFIGRPWPAIMVTSLMFAIVHQNPEHWPTLFVLSCCMGYSYEKSGSLYRPIFIHIIFNTISIASTLYAAGLE